MNTFINFLNNYQFIKYINAPTSGQIGFQNPGTFYMQSVIEFHALVMFYCSIVFLCVAAYLFEVWYFFRASKNPQPTRRQIKDNYKLEYWFMRVPFFIVGIMILPSWALLYASNEPKDSHCIVKAMGSQWQWEYEAHNYPMWVKKGYDWRIFWLCVTEHLKWKTTTLYILDLNKTNYTTLYANYFYGLVWYSIHKKVSNIVLAGLLSRHKVLDSSKGFLTYVAYTWSSITLPVEELLPGHLRLLEASKAVFMPIHQWVRVNISSYDVIHSWAVPSLGVKVDGVPGRLNTIHTLLLSEGLFYGQCSEFCGKGHYKMSIVIKSTLIGKSLKF